MSEPPRQPGPQPQSEPQPQSQSQSQSQSHRRSTVATLTVSHATKIGRASCRERV